MKRLGKQIFAVLLALLIVLWAAVQALGVNGCERRVRSECESFGAAADCAWFAEATCR